MTPKCKGLGSRENCDPNMFVRHKSRSERQKH